MPLDSKLAGSMFLCLTLVLGSASATQGAIVFNLLASGVEAIDEVPSFDYHLGDYTATLTTNVGVLNQEGSLFGADGDGYPLSGEDDNPAVFDGSASVGFEALTITFNQPVIWLNFTASFQEQGNLSSIQFGNEPPIWFWGSGTFNEGNGTLIPTDSFVRFEGIDTNGFSIDRFTILPEPAAALILAPFALALVGRRR